MISHYVPDIFKEKNIGFATSAVTIDKQQDSIDSGYRILELIY